MAEGSSLAFPPSLGQGTAFRPVVGPSSNTGRTEPPPSELARLAPSAHVDFLTFTAPIAKEHQALDDYTELCIEGQCFWIAVLEKLFSIDRKSWVRGRGGFNGYRVKMATAAGAVIAWGGVAQRGTVHVSLPGTVCAGAKDWAAVAQFGELNGAKITRVDLAHDDLQGEYWTVDRVQALYEAGEFANGGRPPARKFIESDSGRTLYIGKRENGKMLRAYEKGRELGDADSPWVRIEGELRSKDRVIAWDVLRRPGEYLAGMYPALRCLHAAQDKIATVKRVASLTLDKAVRVLRIQYGQLLNLLAHKHGGDSAEVLFSVIRPGFPERFAGLRHFLDLSPPPALAG